MAKQTINIGTVANDGTGDPLRSAFDKANDNFTELYGAGALSIASDILTYTKADGTTSTVDLSPYLDEDARAIASGTINGSGIVTFTRDDATTFTLDLSSLLDDTTANDATITLSAGSGLTGGGSFTTDQSSADTVTFDVNVDDSTIEIATDTVQVKADGIDHSHLSASYTALSALGSGSSFAINFDSAATFTATANANATLTMSNAQQGQTVDIIISGNFSITLAETGSTFNKVGTTNYDGTTTNIIQIICTDDSSGSKIYHYAVAPYTSSTTV